MVILGQPALRNPAEYRWNGSTRILHPVTSRGPPAVAGPRIAKWTCEKCANRVYDPNPDYIRVKRSVLTEKHKSEEKSIALHLPSRCRACDTLYGRKKRMYNRVSRIWEFSWKEAQPKFGKGFGRPKFITWAKPTQPCEIDNYVSERESEINYVKSKMRSALAILEKDFKIMGGTYVVECTTRMADPTIPGNFMKLKLHAHVHAVAIGPYIPDFYNKEKRKFERLFSLGLGRINYKAVKGHGKKAKYSMGDYISKYIIKEKTRSVTWGCMRKTKTCN